MSKFRKRFGANDPIFGFRGLVCMLSFYSLFALAEGIGVGSWKEGTPEKWISQPLKSWEKSGASCQLYQSYWVVIAPYSDRVGSKIFVFKRTPTRQFPESCDLDRSKARAQYSDGDYGSVTITNDVLFLDSGSGNWRGLEVLSLEDKKRIATTGRKEMCLGT
jgi:hypothetical protein